MCEVLNLTDKSLHRRVREHYKETYAVVFARKRVGGLISLRRILWHRAEFDKSGDIAKLLAKNYLGMADVQKIDYTDKKGIQELTDEELAAIIEGRRSSQETADPAQGA